MSVIRAFIAIDLPLSIQQKLEEISTQLKQPLKTNAARWTPAKNIHLTLKFLGEVSSSNLELLTKIIAAEVSRYRSFDMTIGELGAFPAIRRPRVIWVGIKAPPELFNLQKTIDTETYKLGYATEDREFSPHLTLARISHNATPDEVRQIGNLLSTTSLGILGTMKVKDVHLYRSDLQPGGAIYTPLFTAPLQNHNG